MIWYVSKNGQGGKCLKLMTVMVMILLEKLCLQSEYEDCVCAFEMRFGDLLLYLSAALLSTIMTSSSVQILAVYVTRTYVIDQDDANVVAAVFRK